MEEKFNEDQKKKMMIDIPYRNMLVAIRHIHIYFQQLCDLPPGELTMLTMIEQFQMKKGKVLASDLVNELSLSRPAVSRMLHTLQKKCLITLKENEKDHRCVEVALCEEGKTLLYTDYQKCLDVLEQVTKNLGKDKINQMIEYNCQFCEELAKVLEEKS